MLDNICSMKKNVRLYNRIIENNRKGSKGLLLEKRNTYLTCLFIFLMNIKFYKALYESKI